MANYVAPSSIEPSSAKRRLNCVHTRTTLPCLACLYSCAAAAAAAFATALALLMAMPQLKLQLPLLLARTAVRHNTQWLLRVYRRCVVKCVHFSRVRCCVACAKSESIFGAGVERARAASETDRSGFCQSARVRHTNTQIQINILHICATEPFCGHIGYEIMCVCKYSKCVQRFSVCVCSIDYCIGNRAAAR